MRRADLFSKEGARAALVEINEQTGSAAEKAPCEHGREALFIRTDIAQEASVVAAVEKAVQAFGKADVLFNKDYPLWLGEPLDIANIALFLASDESRMITGAAIPADGGRSSKCRTEKAPSRQPEGGNCVCLALVLGVDCPSNLPLMSCRIRREEMARFKDSTVPAAAFKPYLEPGEQLKHWAYGVKQPSMLLILPLFALAILPGAIAVALLTKEYVVGLTDRRFIVVRFKGKKVEVKEVIEYPLSALPPVKASTGGLFTHIKILDPAKPFVAKFHRLGMSGNREHAMAIAATLTGKAG